MIGHFAAGFVKIFAFELCFYQVAFALITLIWNWKTHCVFGVFFGEKCGANFDTCSTRSRWGGGVSLNYFSRKGTRSLLPPLQIEFIFVCSRSAGLVYRKNFFLRMICSNNLEGNNPLILWLGGWMD